MTTAKRLALPLLLLAAGALPACTDWAGYDLDMASGKVPQLANMRRSPVPDPYAMPRLPGEHSIASQSPMGDAPAPFTSAALDSVAGTLSNPWAGGAPDAVRARGQVVFHNNCMVCHGPAGGGNGPVVGSGKFPFAPALTTPSAAGRSDGYLYAIVTAGRGFMPPYGTRITHGDRWAVVEYVRSLQQGAGMNAQRAGTPAAPAAAAATPPATAPAAPVAAPAAAPAQP